MYLCLNTFWISDPDWMLHLFLPTGFSGVYEMDMCGLFVNVFVFIVFVMPYAICARLEVTLPVIVHLRRDRGYQRLLPGAGRRPPSDSVLRRNFKLMGELILLKRGDPQVILEAFCDKIFPFHAPIILYINNPYFHGSDASTTHYLRGITQFLGLPVIRWDPEHFSSVQPKSQSRNLIISPTIQHQVKAMLSVLARFNWTDFSIVTTDVPGHEDFIGSLQDAERASKATDAYEAVESSKPRYRILDVLTLREDESENMCETLQRLLESDSRVTLLYSRGQKHRFPATGNMSAIYRILMRKYPAAIRQPSFAWSTILGFQLSYTNRSKTFGVMDCAHKLKMTGEEYVWVLSMDSVPKTSKSWAAPKKWPYGLFGVWYDYGKEAMVEAIETGIEIWSQALRKTVRGDARNSRVVMNGPNFTCSDPDTHYWADGARMYETLRSVSVYGKHHQKIDFNSDGQLKYPRLKIINLQRTNSAGGKNWTEVGQWTRDGLSMQRVTWPGEAFGPPKGKPKRRFLRIATLRENPYVIYEAMPAEGVCGTHRVPCQIYPRDEESFKRLSNETNSTCCTGLSIDLLLKLSAALNFDYELFEVYDGLWGAEVNGEWNGLVRVLMDKKADMVMTSLKITPERNRAVDFSVPYLKTGITIIVSIREGAISPTAFLEPYDYPSWCFILVFSVHATGTSIFIFEWLSPYGLDKGASLSKDHRFSLFRSLWLIWAMLFSAAVSTDTPRGISSRFLANLWALFALVFLASYTANLAAFMITKEDYYDLSGIQDWRLQNPKIMKPPFKFGTIPNGSTDTNIRSNDLDMYSYMQRYNRPSVEEGIKAVKRQQLHAFIYDATVLEYRAGKDKECRLITVGKWGAMTGYGVAFPRGSPWIDKANNIILELKKEGEMERLQKFWLSGACHNAKKKDPHSSGFGKGVKSTTLGIRNFTSAFMFLACGIGLGAILLLLEHLYFRFGRKKLKKWDKRGCCALVSLSMGRSLTFQQYVTEAMDARRRHRCKDRVCQANFWKVQHELDLALGKVDKLQTLISNLRQQKEENCAWKFEREDINEVCNNQLNAPQTEAEEIHQEMTNEQKPRRRQGNNADSGSDAAQVQKVKDELMRLLQSEYERESVI